MRTWLNPLLDLHRAGIRCALITVTRTRGSTPRAAGTRMLVSADAIFGTVGGGQLEYLLVEKARSMLAAGEADRRATEALTLGPEINQCCGGVVEAMVETLTPGGNDWLNVLADRSDTEPCVLVSLMTGGTDRLVVSNSGTGGRLAPENLHRMAVMRAQEVLESPDPPAILRYPQTEDAAPLLLEYLEDQDFHVMLFGAGHVGRALVGVLATLPCRVTWIDSRAEAFPATVPDNVDCRLSDAPWELAHLARPRSFVLVMTHSHPADFRICEAILARSCAFLGLIGSRSKRNRFRKHLARRGVPAHALDRLVCPIGIEGISGKHPGEIAVAATAQLLQLRERYSESVTAPEAALRSVLVES